MQFHYLAINQENQQLNGNIHADDEQAARKELNKLGFSVLSVKLVNDEETSVHNEQFDHLLKFKFSAIDSTGKKIIGTISSKDSKHAYVRLIQEYHFKVESMINVNTPNNYENLTELAQFYESMSAQNKQPAKDNNINPEENKLSSMQASFIKEIDNILHSTDDIYGKYNRNLSMEGRKKISESKETLMRIKGSYNLDYVKQVAQSLLNILVDQNNFEHDAESKDIQNKIALESQKMLLKINQLSTSNTAINDISSSFSSFMQHKDNKQETPSKIIKNKEAATLAENLRQNWQEIKNDLVLWFRSSAQNRAILQNDIKELFKKRKNLKKNWASSPKITPQSINRTKNEVSIEAGHNLWLEIYYFSGWLTLFYLIYYFVSYYIWTKTINFSVEMTKFIADPYAPSLIRNVTLLLFSVHCFMSIQKNCLLANKKHLWIGALSGSVFTLLLISNF
ncbi:MAG: hypothetical protein UR28_C0007G0019 [Candidatus Peregrinibacteria bacterium GW2011_GWF2_33_10]|nr:MAG: hypothetical protein UR28_C0007G0019 [Candidatus Peregrinibacteria bacterium GW2011_GWF2_33_10]OGJ44250.1 MAG: hypothetical protein A2272_04140 [Candidatus Peregrinibacteria bacterium RIFOXYA12_FULL_33_12]OGJ44908.1 MAG: hypothetical protein A2263_03205 [Candidatus Peregrinibacteria bacterium RIFOXYA2_FULL_33_21]OGJ50667.1 MAG: hypothetical protein A2307_03495 [Candidatus Peregrinibacteria bacterium RIFOXYB2_FULL_33_20]